MPRLCSIAKGLLGVALLAAITVGAIRINAGEMTKKIRVLYTDDTMGYWQPCG